MKNCPTCGQTIGESHAVNIDRDLDSGGWWEWSSGFIGRSRLLPGYGMITLIERKDDTREEMGLDDQEVYMIFKLEVNGTPDRFFKKAGTADSYGDVEWDRFPLIEVYPTEKTITVYEPKGN